MFVFKIKMFKFSVRGTVNAMGFLINSLGSLTGFIVAIWLDFRMQAVSALTVPILFAFVFYFVPESPVALYEKNAIEVKQDDYTSILKIKFDTTFSFSVSRHVYGILQRNKHFTRS